MVETIIITAIIVVNLMFPMRPMPITPMMIIDMYGVIPYME